ncbi:MAG: heavy metal translocating P-type ATPase [bacterium]|nr:heavy metal translocating P-type ATPase [bacterium]
MNKQLEKKYTIVNLGCANCAAKMETAMNKDHRISSASVNFMNNTVFVSYEPNKFDNEQHLFEVLNNYVTKYEREAYLAINSQTTSAVTAPSQEEACGCGCEDQHSSHEEAYGCECEDQHSSHEETCGCGCCCSSSITTEEEVACSVVDTAAMHKHTHTHEHTHEHGSEDHSIKGIVKTAIPWIVGIGISLIGIYLVDQPVAKILLILAGYIVLGHEVLLNSFNSIRHGSVFDENFLMIVATIGALYVGEYTEAIAVLLLFQIGELLQDLAVDNSRRHLTDAMNLKSLFATIETFEGLKQVAPEQVQVNDLLVVKPSEKIALDGIVVEGTSFLDTSSLTGESVPRKASVGDDVLSGCINGEQTLKIKVTKPYTESTVAKVLDLVENASNRKSVTENFITKFARIYTPIVVLLAVLLIIVPPIVTGSYDFQKWIYTACSFLVVSCPCALVISVPLGFFGGIGAASKNGIIVKGSNYLEGLTTLKTVVFDKTGTLTKGCFAVKEIKAVSNVTEQEILETAALLESFSTHPIATSILTAYKQYSEMPIDIKKLSDYKELSGHGVQANIDGITYSLGNKRYMETLNASNIPISIDTIGTIAYLAKGTDCIGYLVISDEIKEDAKATIRALKKHGIQTVLLTGDTKIVADKVANSLGIDTVYSELLPTDKVTKLEEVMNTQSEKESTAFVGDGINDAPVIARADIGMAMGGVGSDAAIEAADIVLMTDEPGKIAKAIAIAKHTKRIVTTNIVFSLGIKVLVLLLLALGFGSMWLAIFADVGVSLIAIMNSIRALNDVD